MRPILLTLLIALTLPHNAVADDANQVNLFGRPIRKTQDYLVTHVVSVVGTQSIIAIGEAHGLLEDMTLMALRYEEDEYRRVGFVKVVLPKRDRSVVRPVGDFRPQKNDILLIPASRLDLWHGLGLDTDAIVKNEVRKKKLNGYDTRSEELDGDTLLEEIRVEEARLGIFWKNQVQRGREELGQAELSTAGTGDKEPDPKLYPTQNEWLSGLFKRTVLDGWVVIPMDYGLFHPEDKSPRLLPKLAQKWRTVP